MLQLDLRHAGILVTSYGDVRHVLFEIPIKYVPIDLQEVHPY